MQPNYSADGWLDKIIKNKNQINFMKYSTLDLFNIDFCNLLKSMVTTVNDENIAVYQKNSFDLDYGSKRSVKNFDKVLLNGYSNTNINCNVDNIFTDKNRQKINNNWSNKDVESWLIEKNIDKRIIKMLKYFDGDCLKQLNSIRLSAPDYYYTVVSQNNKIHLWHVLHFTRELEYLF